RHVFGFGSTGSGKSSLLKEAIGELWPDIKAGKKTGLVMDGTELCDEIISQLDLTDDEIRKHIVFIDLAKPGGPDDIGCLPRFNMMEMGDGTGGGDAFVDLDARINLFEMLFDGLMDTDTSGPMKIMMSYAAQTMAALPNPTVDDLLALLKAPLAFTATIRNLDPDVRDYWEGVIKLDKNDEEVVNETARALFLRAKGLLGRPIIKRLLVNDHPTVNFAKRFNEGGTLFLIAVRKGKLMPLGARLVGRFILTMILRAVGARNSLGKPVKSFCAIDEAHNFFNSGQDESFMNLLAEARKHWVSLWMFLQEERQTSPAMINSILTNCHIILGSNGMSEAMARMIRDKIGVETHESGKKKGKPKIELTKIPLFSFVASLRGNKPIMIKTKEDPLGDKYTRIPKGDKAGPAFVEARMERVHRIMREEYAQLPAPEVTEDEQPGKLQYLKVV
ncbi:MAG: hypothetical protein ACR2RE_03085, partial [Geminicoccaceae bacterium]